MPGPLSQATAIQESYDDVAKMLRKIALAHARRMHNADLNPKDTVDEAIALANLGFMNAYTSFDLYANTYFSTWCYLTVLRTLQEAVRRRPPLATVPLENIKEPTTVDVKPFQLDDFLHPLSSMAQTAVQAVLSPPSKLQQEAEANGGGIHNYRACLKRYLRNTCGWTLRQCKETFQEIAEALKC